MIVIGCWTQKPDMFSKISGEAIARLLDLSLGSGTAIQRKSDSSLSLSFFFEKIVHDRLRKYPNKSKLLTSFRYLFRNISSTELSA